MRFLKYPLGLGLALIASGNVSAGDAAPIAASAPSTKEKIPCEIAQQLTKNIYTYVYNVSQSQPQLHLETIDTGIASIKIIVASSENCATATNYATALSTTRTQIENLPAPEVSVITPKPPRTRTIMGGTFEGAIKPSNEEITKMLEQNKTEFPTLMKQTIKTE
jgi:hypothetical protein